MMTSHGKLRREKGSLAEYESQMKDLRAQLTDQIKILDSQIEVKQQQLSDLSEFLRRRGDIEAEYARALDKLTERFTHKTKKKEQWGQSVCQVWSVLLTQTRLESREHSTLGDTCCSALTQRLVHSTEDTHRLHKRSKEVGIQMQDELLKVTTELQTALKTYNQYHTDCLIAEGKLKEAERLEERHTGKSAELGLGQSGGQRRSSVKKMERLMEKRHGRVQETQLKCTKARNDYLLNLAAANAAMNKYYLQDVSTLIDCCDLGFHQSVERVMKCYMASRWRIQKTEEAGLKQLEAAVTSLDQGGDRDALLQQHDSAFCLPFRFNYHPHEGDQVCEVSAESQVRYEMETRFQQLQSRLAAVTLETEEVSKTLKATLTALLDSMCDSDCNPTPDVPSNLLHEPPGAGSVPKLTLAKRRANQQETETYYFIKVKEFLTSSSLTFKLQAKHDLLQDAIQKAEAVNTDPSRAQCARSVRVRKSRPISQFCHTLFSTDILSYIKSSGQQIPVVVESCIRFINLHGLHHEGIFRVPGSQREVNLIKDAFERGEDPLSDSECDLDSVAGVLKLYFRGLEPPLFPYDSYLQLLECVQIEDMAEKAAQIRAIVSAFPRPLLIVMRYLFAFLNHVTQYSDENMMQSYNLAVCFGPSLLRGVDSDDAVARQPQVNDLVKTMILQHDVIFPGQSELPGAIYEKHMTLEQEYCEPITEEGDGEAEHLPSEDDSEAVAMFDYTARSPAELSFKQGELLILHSKASSDWWRGEAGGVKGLIPHKYISVLEGSERGKRDEGGGGGGSTGNLSADDPHTENTVRMRVNSDGASLPGRQRGSDGSPGRKPPTSPAARHLPVSQERRHTLDTVRQAGFKPADRPAFVQADRTTADKEMISRQMNSVFKELLSRQPPMQPPTLPATATPAPPSSSSSASTSSPSTPLPQAAPTAKKVGFGIRGRALFRPVD
ncbi:SLIT-ROBO Rho GTPase-activating protein 3-like isoform X1 [Phyllopteryx taeniolatus]|uniref:SLIT-ROBO Rho GTPase-activating protein 3-like isoform X1 n=1 Tax=Phyllopteryx taeniolatus TaxID=161469 RepID=UPI002AD3F368|nr:SLIT-ROBO Rho GTPase-activating protein 3-like isoform X1 [Phyllopteryx taeniolatus]XP_061636985.1 SLIT-ROBO Rho GTPase-activating protein 3-like isoform X1 [Phyllopteryx taeniolatus]XP_061636995.1 SLIT-ROBO Rho GTPase-activating protein 3-like isoform X1 [Phyllopteryx taeniolatus]